MTLMATHVALLRGINVGGKNKVAMADLREVVAGLGHADVSTYIQSGNVLFSPDPADADTAVNRDLRGDGDLVARRHELHRAEEAGAVAGGKKLLGIGAFAARAAQFPGGGQLEVEIACGDDSTSIAAACGVSMGAVEDFFE